MYLVPALHPAGKISRESRTNPVAAAAGIVLAAGEVYLLLTRRARFGRHLPLHPASPRPGTVPRMARGLRPRVR